MKTLSYSALKTEFEARIFISIGIVLTFCLLSFMVFRSAPDNLELIGQMIGIESGSIRFAGYILMGAVCLLSSVLRMWAGSVLTSNRVMSFKVRNDNLTTFGPFALVRNPIYLADFIALSAFAICLKPIGLLLPIFFYFHYVHLIQYEEIALEQQFGSAFRAYQKSTPRFIPSWSSIQNFLKGPKHFMINYDGLRHNALYTWFIVGFVVAAFTDNLLYALLIGFPGVIDWAVIHTVIGTKPLPGVEEDIVPKSQDLDQARVFEDVVYAQCWEDPEIDREAFQIGPEDVVFSITSGGCNALAFLIDDPAKIIALDLNPTQNYLLELKMAGFRSLTRAELLAFLGVIPSETRMHTYRSIKEQLSMEARKYWDENPDMIRGGVIHCGRYEKYMRSLGKWLRRIIGARAINRMFDASGREERQLVYESMWNNVRWKLFTRIFLSRWVMTYLFDKAFFAQLEDSFSFGDHFRSVVKRGVTRFSASQNPFLSYMLSGRYSSLDHLPLYLRKESFELIRSRIDRISIHNESCESLFERLPESSVSKFNFTNIFEWMSEEDFGQLLRSTIRVAQDGAVITYRNLLVDRNRPTDLARWIVPRTALANKLHGMDRSFIYKAYVVEEIVKK
jgi:S-adenosylmethionine-diacylglycerol 3-amino-3-carboxypropyl transferase